MAAVERKRAVENLPQIQRAQVKCGHNASFQPQCRCTIIAANSACHNVGLESFGEPGGTRTRDHRIKSAMLYQLSYRPLGNSTRAFIVTRAPWPPRVFSAPRPRRRPDESAARAAPARAALPGRPSPARL